MSKQVKALLVVGALSLSAAVAAPAAAAAGAEACPNEQLRAENSSATLPDCRAYELVSPDSNHASLGAQSAGLAAQDGQSMDYQTIDAPDTAESASTFNIVHATRNPVTGWSGSALSAPSPAPVTSYASFTTWALAADLLSTFVVSDQPLTPGPLPSGQNNFLRAPDGTYHLVTKAGAPFIPGLEVYAGTPTFSWGNEDFSTVFFKSAYRQFPQDPLEYNNAYDWSVSRGLHMVGILPGGEPAPGGAVIVGDSIRVPGSRRLAPASQDGRYVVFNAEEKLFLRIDDAHTVELGPGAAVPAPGITDFANVAADGSSVIFASNGDLTPDADKAGRDIYRYDTATGHLTDLTVDANPADAATGAGIQWVLSASGDNAYVYFTATGDLAAGATPGHTSLYVAHNNTVEFVADANGLASNSDTLVPFFNISADGRHAVFSSTDSLTGYDNTDPVTGRPHPEIFEATVGAGLKCVSCRADGTQPTGESSLPFYKGLPGGALLRPVSDDGSRVFFQSTDAVVPQASSTKQVVFEYSGGRATPISPVDSSTPAIFLDASATGDDVFIATHDELSRNPDGGDFAIYDARVDGGFPGPAGRCAGLECQIQATPPPSLLGAATVTFTGQGNAGPLAIIGADKVTVSRPKAIRGTVGSLRIAVPAKGRLTVSGPTVQSRRSSLAGATTVSVRLALTRAAARAMSRKRSLRATVKVTFAPAEGKSSSVTLSVTFKPRVSSPGKGR